MSKKTFIHPEPAHSKYENQKYLSEQLITYLGNKRRLLGFIGSGVAQVQRRLTTTKLKTFDVFSGSGVVARYLKQFSSHITVNDLESYSRVINQCYLSSSEEFNNTDYLKYYKIIKEKIDNEDFDEGFITRLYSPKDDTNIQYGERVFYTRRNALFIDTVRKFISDLPESVVPYFLAPLLSQASIHSNTSGVFKGFYKNANTKIGQFGGTNRDALTRITSDMKLNKPIFSRFDCDYHVFQEDANKIVKEIDEIDLAYIDPPYNQHPYGSNYFMLNLIVDYVEPDNISKVSGIPTNWNRSDYNRRQKAFHVFEDLIENIKAKFVIISFNSEGFISLNQMKDLLEKHGKLTILETNYNTFRGCRNLRNRDKHVTEYLYLLEKS